MDVQQFHSAVQALTEADLQAVLDGAGLVVFQDAELRIGREDEAFVIYEIGSDAFASTADLRAHLIEQAPEYLQSYYQFNPLSKEYFNRRLQALFDEFDALSFATQPGSEASRALFVDGGELVCEAADSPRFKYGLTLKLDEKMPETAMRNKLKNWLQSGSAYGDYISVNVCRFSAM